MWQWYCTRKCSYDWIEIIQNHAKDEAYKRDEKANEILKEVIPIEFKISEKEKRECSSKKWLKQYSSLYGIHPSIFLLRTKGYYVITNMIRKKLWFTNKEKWEMEINTYG